MSDSLQTTWRFRMERHGADFRAALARKLSGLRRLLRSLVGLAVLLRLATTGWADAADWVVYEGKDGPGKGKRIVFLSGDEEYRSEEGLPMLARILAFRHGFRCTVLFAINPSSHTIDPVILTNIPGMAALDTADLCVMALRFRELPDKQMKHFADYMNAGKPLIALRTSTHAFAYEHNKQSPYAKYDWRDKDWPGGFGQQVLGETLGRAPRRPRQAEHARCAQRGVQGPPRSERRQGSMGPD